METRIFGVAGSPVKGGNVEALLDRMMDAVAKKKGVSVETAHLSRLDVQDCIHCNFCLRKQTDGKYCSLDDDAQPLFDKAEAADILILATPVYFLRTSGRMASFIDRLRVFVFGNVAGGKMKNKVGVSAAVAWGRHAGFETAHLSHLFAFLTLEMIPASVHHSISPMGASAVASPQGSGVFDKSIRHGIDHDPMGLHSASAIMNRALELSLMLRRGAAGG